SAFLFLVFLLHCSQTCLAAGHAHAAIAVPVSTHDNPAHAPCHSSPTPPQRIPEKCADCAGHVFLPSVASGPATLAAAGVFSIPFCFPVQPLPSALPPPYAGVFRLDPTVLSPPLYRTLSVLRL